MIKLKSLILENKNIIVGVITTDDEVFSHKDAIDHGDLSIKIRHKTYGKATKNNWRYNKIEKIVYWWYPWTKTDGELVIDHLKHKYNYEVVKALLIDVPDRNVYIARFNKAHGLEESITGLITIFQGRNIHNKGSKYFTTNKEWAQNFTQSGRENEIIVAKIDPKVIYTDTPLPEATNEKMLEKTIEVAKNQGYKAIWVDEGIREPHSVFILDSSVIKIIKPSIIKESVQNVRFEKDDTVMLIDTPKGTYKASVFSFVRNGILKYNFDIMSPPDKYVDYQIDGKIHKIAHGGFAYLGHVGTNVEQIYAGLSDKLKELGLPYVHVNKLKIKNLDTKERNDFVNQLKNVVSDFNKETQKPENQPKDFGKGPPDFGQWISGEDIRTGRLKWVIDNYGDFWIVIKWSISPREQKKASEFLKNYDKIISGKEGAGDHCREVYVRKSPFESI